MPDPVKIWFLSKTHAACMMGGMSKPTTPDNYADALDTIESARILRSTAQRFHRAADGNRDPRIPELERQVSDGLKIAHTKAELAAADQLAAINRTLVVGLDGISQKLADLVEMFTEALEANDEVDVDCTRCGGPIMLDTFKANDGMCEACRQHVDEEIDAGVSGPHEGEDRA